MTSVKRVVIIGASAAGASAATAVRRLDPDCHLTLISDEPVPLYSRCLLSDYLMGQVSRQRLTFQPPDWPKGLNANVILEAAVELDPAARWVATASGRRIPYDGLLVATGASPILPPIPGLDTGGVFAPYRLEQMDAVLAALPDARQGIVLGAGKVGVKAAEALAARGIAVTLLEQASHVLPDTLDVESAVWMQELLSEQGIKVVTGATVIEIASQGGRVAQVKLDSGQWLPCDLLLVAIGTYPNAGLAREAGIKVGRGILVDAHTQTSAEGNHAAGDVSETPQSGSGELEWVPNWFNAMQQGRVAGRNLAGEAMQYPGGVRANAFRLCGLPIVSVGELDGVGNESWQRLDRRAQLYRRLVFRDGRLIGALEVGGELTDAGILSSLVKSGAKVGGLEEALFADGLAVFASQRGRRLLAEMSRQEV